MNNRKRFAGVLWLAVAAAGTPCLGQVYQKNYSVNPGQVLDRSPQVGSSGYNGGGGQGAVGSYGTMVRDNNLYVTGQTTGLSAFQGPIPYTPSSQFQIGLPTASLSTFMQQSVGAGDVARGTTLGAAPYFDTSKTILGSASIGKGYASPGTNVPLVPTVDMSVRATLNSQNYQDALADYKSVLPTSQGRILSVALQEVPTSLYVPASLQGVTGYAAQQQFASILEGLIPGRGNLFDLLNDRDRSALGQQFYEFLQARKAAEPNALTSLANEAWQKPDYSIPQLDSNSWLASPAGRRPGDANLAPMAPRENVDVFQDVITQMGLRREGLGRPGAAPRGPTVPGATLVEVTPEHQIIIHSLAGRANDLTNRAMREAGVKLMTGKYYDAAQAYAMAASANLRHPLPHVGRALALVGAGDPASAAREIQAALEVFPSLIEVRLDLSSLMNMNDLRARVTELDARIARNEAEADPLLPLLACYLHFNLNELPSAKLYAQQVKEGDLKNKVVQAFAEYVLTGKRPSAQTQPAATPMSAPAGLTNPAEVPPAMGS
jgi:hypothetical protein